MRAFVSVCLCAQQADAANCDIKAEDSTVHLRVLLYFYFCKDQLKFQTL